MVKYFQTLDGLILHHQDKVDDTTVSVTSDTDSDSLIVTSAAQSESIVV